MMNAKSKFKNFIFIFTFAVLLTNCKKGSDSTTTGNPFVSFTVTSSSSVATVAQNLKQFILRKLVPNAQALPPPGTLIDANGNTVSLTQSWQTIAEIEFKFDEVAGGTEIDENSVEFTGPFTVNLFSNNPQPMTQGFIQTSQIRRLKAKLSKTLTLPTGAPAGLLNKSLYFAGTVNGFSFNYSTEEETALEVAGPNLVNAVNESELLLELRIANLIKRINLSAINTNTSISENHRVPATSPCPNIDNSATDLYTCFRKGIESESNLGRDEDGDDQIDLNEESVE